MNTTRRIWNVFDPLYCETRHEDTHTLPAWATRAVVQKLFDYNNLAMHYMYNTEAWLRLRGGEGFEFLQIIALYFVVV